jgi:hypothetical protein
MHAWLFNLLLLANTLMLTLPPGSCCRELLRAGEAKPAAKACCREHSPADSSSSAPAPLAQHCRCPREAVAPSKARLEKPRGEFAGWTAPLPLIAPERISLLAAGRAIERFQNPGPSLQILLCVWRC